MKLFTIVLLYFFFFINDSFTCELNLNKSYAGWRVIIQPPYIKLKRNTMQYPTLWFDIKERLYNNKERYLEIETLFLEKYNDENNTSIVDLEELARKSKNF